MNPVTHGLIGWLTANASSQLSRRQRNFITAAAVIPDIDGLGVIPEFLTRGQADPVDWWSRWHHVVGHNGLVGVLFACLAAGLVRTQRGLTFALVLTAFHLHILGDLIGGRGAEGETWPLAYFWPFTEAITLDNPWMWALNAWPNILITIIAMAVTFTLAVRRGYSPVGIFSTQGDERFIETLRQRFQKR